MKNICSIFIMLSLFIFALVQQGVAGSVEEVEELFTEFVAAAERGDVRSQTMLGIMYERGIGVSPDPAMALEWFRAAADRGDPSGQTLVGRAYADGRGVPHDDEEALVWFHKGAQSELREFVARQAQGQATQGRDNLVSRIRGFAGGYEGAIKAAESGNAMAQTTVGKMYLTGSGVTQNDVEAVRWLTEGTKGFAAAGAERALAIMYEEGRGCLPKDNAEAMRLYRKAAEQLARITGSGLTMICLTLTGQADCRGTQAHAGALEDGRAAIGEGDYDTALRLLMPLAKEGNPAAQNAVGVLYLKGWGVDQDYPEALRWFRKAAEQGNPKASFNIAKMHENGWGVVQSCAEALMWFRKPAEQGNAVAQVNLGGLYDDGSKCIPQNHSEAMRWYRKAAEQGDALGQKNLGAMYGTGEGVAQDFTEAMKWYRKAAAQGYAGAQYSLGYMYEHGEGMAPNEAEAAKWYRMAAEQGHPGAIARLEALVASASSSAPRVPSLDVALSASATDLAKSYDGVRILVDFLPLAEQGANIVAEGRTISRENVAEMRSELETRLAVYETAIQERGYTKISGRYRAKATSSCQRIQSMWAGGIRQGILQDTEVSQDGFDFQLVYKHEYEGTTFKIQGIVVETVITFRDPMNSDFVFLGQIGTSEIRVRPDVEAVLASWPTWAKGPSRSDLATCTVTLSPISR